MVLLKFSSLLPSLGFLFLWSPDHSSILCHWLSRVFLQEHVCPEVPLVCWDLEHLSDIVAAGLMQFAAGLMQFAVLMSKAKPISWLYQENRALIFQVKSRHKWNSLGWRKKH